MPAGDVDLDSFSPASLEGIELYLAPRHQRGSRRRADSRNAGPCSSGRAARIQNRAVGARLHLRSSRNCSPHCGCSARIRWTRAPRWTPPSGGSSNIRHHSARAARAAEWSPNSWWTPWGSSSRRISGSSAHRPAVQCGGARVGGVGAIQSRPAGRPAGAAARPPAIRLSSREWCSVSVSANPGAESSLPCAFYSHDTVLPRVVVRAISREA